MKRGKLGSLSSMILGAMVLAALGGCGGGPATVSRSEFVEFSPEQKAEIEENSSHEYRIQEGDVLRVAFSYQKDLNQEEVVVLHDGSVNLVGVDRIEVGEEILLDYGEDYFQYASPGARERDGFGKDDIQGGKWVRRGRELQNA